MMVVFFLFSFLMANNVQFSEGKKLMAEEIVGWNKLGVGACQVDHGQVYMQEGENGVGLTLVSPLSYEGDIIVRYKLMPLNPATVCVFILNAVNTSDGSIKYPKQYNGYVQFWTQDVDCYFFAFHNEAHNWMPFLQKSSCEKKKSEKLQIAEKYGVATGKYNDVEIGRKAGHIWMKVNGDLLMDVEDDLFYKNGHVAFRIRGTGNEQGSCLIKDVEVIQ